MEYRCKVTVLDKKLYPDLQEQYCAVPDSGNPDSVWKGVFKASFRWHSLRYHCLGKLRAALKIGRKYRFYCHIYPAGRRSVRDCIIFGAGNCEI